MSPRLPLLVLAVCIACAPGCKKKSNTRVASAGDRDTPVDRTTGVKRDDGSHVVTVRGGEDGDAIGSATIYFEFDSTTLTSEARNDLERVATWLASHREATLTIEGHCDERGTTEYNVALGQRRAQAIQDHLVRLGVAANRLSTISYGEERPAATGETEDAYARNRRGELVTSR